MSQDFPSRSRRSAQNATIARHGRLKKSRALVSLVKIVAGALAVLLLSGVSLAAIVILDLATSGKKSVRLANEKPGQAPVNIDAIQGGVNLLLIGSDGGEGDPQYDVRNSSLNDVNILLHIAQDHSNATVVSFPRDMEIPVPSCPDPVHPETGDLRAMSRSKINAVLEHGGLPCVVKTVEKLTGIEIPFAAQIEFNGAVAVSTAVGGVPVCVAKPIQDDNTGADFPAGINVLQGADALKFLRTRKAVGDGSDITRVSNQQLFMSSMIRTLKSKNTLEDPLKVYAIAKAIVSNTTLSTSLNSVETIAKIAVALKKIPLDKVVFVQYPMSRTSTGAYIPNRYGAESINEALLNDEAITLSGGTGGGTVSEADAQAIQAESNGSGDSSSANPSPSASATPSPSTDGATVLPQSVTGQNANEVTCTKGRPKRDQ